MKIPLPLILKILSKLKYPVSGDLGYVHLFCGYLPFFNFQSEMGILRMRDGDKTREKPSSSGVGNYFISI